MSVSDQYIQSLKGPILVAGASGFIGANLLRMILRVRPDVIGVVQQSKNWRLANVPDEKIAAANMNDMAAVRHLINTVDPQTVFDCIAYGAYSFEKDAHLVYETNFLAVTNLVKLLAERNISAFIHAGSSSEYGTNSAAPAEHDPGKPNSDYSVSKIATASFLAYMGKHKQFPCVNLRLYSIYGPLEDTSRLMPNVVNHALRGTLPDFVDARTSRDFVYVDDACEAFILAAAKMNPVLYGESLNIGSGTKTTIAELAQEVVTQFAVNAEPRFGTMQGRSWDLPDWYADPSLADKLIGWKAGTPLRVGLQRMGDWLKTLTQEQFATGSKMATIRSRRSVSAIIACYKDAQAIPFMHERLTRTFQKIGIDYEIIFVNDGSPDDSAEVIRRISEEDPKVIGITHARNFGSQMAFRSGMELSSKDAVVLLDGDLQDPPELIEDFYRKWEEGFDVVYGRRIKRDMPWHWGLMYKSFYRVFAAFSYVKIPLDAGDFSLIDRRVVFWLLNCTERDLFLRGLRAYVGFKQTGVDYVRPERMFGVSTNNLIKNIDWAKKGIFSFSNVPLTMLTTGGLAALALSTVAAVIVALLRLLVPDIAPRGITTLLISILMFGSLNLFAIGLVGEYIAKIMVEVKGRPRLIRESLIRHGKSTKVGAELIR
ncbi:dolichol-phosphate mannosyltransferase [Silvimonas terrae]|uniref:Dolichol-phosphate mannosyltransferase n=1 Tax=Silvimonas terrae TaxID=300266 RepID=A0A840RJ71_9NEIS|nr:NAD-dependent epimerase/dehydratase family protein [Silvimonas terrae]MBB5192356.1 dolichol-phosphate mannosyltransferase [Silvimonas terrae]